MLAAKVGAVSVDQMLASMTPAEFNERYAGWLLDGWGEEWQHAGTIAAATVNAVREALAAYAGRSLPAHDRLTPADFIPPVAARKPDKPERRDPERWARERYG